MKKRNFVAIVMAIVLCLSFMTTTSFAVELIEKLVIETNIDDVLKAGEPVKPLNITVTAPEYPLLKIKAIFEGWYTRLDTPDGISKPEKYEGEKFLEKYTYFYDMKIKLPDPTYKFAEKLSLVENGKEYDYYPTEEEKQVFVSHSLDYKAKKQDPEEPGGEEPGEPGGEEPGEPGGPSETVKVIVYVNNDEGQKMTISFNKGEEFPLPNTLPYGGHAPKGKKLVSWEVNGEPKKIGEKITVADGMTLKAIWENKDTSDPEEPGEPGGPGSPDLVKITFIYGEGSENRFEDKAPKNEEIQLPKQNELGIDVSKLEGKELIAWLVNGKRKEIGEKVKASEDLIITAIWKNIGTPDPEPETPSEPSTPTPTEPEEPEDDYTPYIPKRPSIPTEKKTDEKSEIKKEENPIEKPAEKAERKVILTINSKDMNNEANGENSHTAMDVAPYIKDGRTMLPIRYIAEALGMSVTWDKKTRTVIIEDKAFRIEIPVDTNKIIVNGEVYTSDVKPEIKNRRTMMPIANIARAIGLVDGKDILWDAKTKQVTIIRKIFE